MLTNLQSRFSLRSSFFCQILYLQVLNTLHQITTSLTLHGCWGTLFDQGCRKLTHFPSVYFHKKVLLGNDYIDGERLLKINRLCVIKSAVERSGWSAHSTLYDAHSYDFNHLSKSCMTQIVLCGRPSPQHSLWRTILWFSTTSVAPHTKIVF